jgi:hypothetical protein
VYGANRVIPITLKVSKNASEQTKRRGRRLSIIGFLQPIISFVYGLVIGGVNRKSYIEMMVKVAQEALELGRIRVIVQDNGPIHRCSYVQQLWSKWQQMGLYIFFLPKLGHGHQISVCNVEIKPLLTHLKNQRTQSAIASLVTGHNLTEELKFGRM